MRFAAMMLAAMAVLGTAAASAQPSGRNAPNPAACRHIKWSDGAEVERKGPIPVPRVWSGVVRSERPFLAVSTLGGRTLCVETSGIENIDEPELSGDGRFLRFAWYGYETGGYMVVDRAGKGVVFDTGDKPVPSPSGQLAAAVQYSEAGFGSLEGFGLWQVGKPPMRELARLYFPEGFTDWQLDGWQGNACVRLSAVRFEDMGEDQRGKPRRRPFLVRPAGKGWAIVSGSKGACPKP